MNNLCSVLVNIQHYKSVLPKSPSIMIKIMTCNNKLYYTHYVPTGCCGHNVNDSQVR